MGKKSIEVGDFIKYKGYLMAVVATDPEQNICYALCSDNHKMARFDLDAEGVEFLTVGCKALVNGIYGDMEHYRRNHSL